GTEFEAFGVKDGLPEDSINALHVDKDGTLWVGTAKGILRRQGNRFLLATAETGVRQRTSIASDSRATVYVASDKGLFASTDAGRFRRLDGAANGASQGVYVDAEDIAWFGCGKAICRWDGKHVQTYAAGEGVAQGHWGGFQHDPTGHLLARYGSRL